ncbi:hypothetical protein OKW21_001615 [Catalinimonas alkaloidigena]|uniref:hypothetical protein n=1 Tax=Catalinimonas alkaloidigena TaxID=1075417 RepID=UPI002406ADDD|nr:hypothetical protein [Catalinimonas alkaloidigena]MDF9796352.1 hypothetical protein [Catalinimonas alkaloidigena]
MRKFYIISLLLFNFSTTILHGQTKDSYTDFLNELPSIKATHVKAPPEWAIIQRLLIRTMEEATPVFVARFMREDGSIYGEGPYDDVYEMFYNWPEFYTIGADKYLYEKSLLAYNAITRTNTTFYRDSINYHHRLHKEFPRHDDFFHISEGMTLFYNLGLTAPQLPANVRRARRFAGFYLNEDPEAPNFDPENTLVKSIFTGSEGPLASSSAEYNLRYGHASLYPVEPNLEPEWNENPQRTEEVQALYDQVVTRTDVPVNLGITGLITNAYLYTGEEKYKQWVLDYVDAWMQRIEENDGLLPDNIGLSGKIGEYRNGQWWGGLYGWYARYGLMMMFAAMSNASECAYLLSGDPKYLDLLRSQIKGLINRAQYTEEGQMLVPFRMKREGWYSYRPMMARDLAHLWHASLAEEDWQMVEKLLEGSKYRPLSDEGIWGQNTLVEFDNKTWEKGEAFDPAQEMSISDRSLGKSEYARLMYYAGKNPDWPVEALKADLQEVIRRVDFMHKDERDPGMIEGDELHPNNPILTKALVQTTMGAPQSIYFGGLLRASLRYFDAEAKRPGLPPNVAALVSNISADMLTVEVVNLSLTESKSLLVQAGAFGEHSFEKASFMTDYVEESSNQTTTIDGRYFLLEIPPLASIVLNLAHERYVNQPTYAFPWQHK